MPDEQVPASGAAPAGAGAQPQGGRGDEKVTLTKAEFDSIRRERDEARESERAWANMARRGAAPTEREEEAPELVETEDLIPEVTGDDAVDEAIFNDPDKWAEAISKGPAAIKALIKKVGLVDAKQAAEIAAKVARRTVDVERGKMTSDAHIMGQFPDLQDPKSELYKETALQVQDLVKLDPAARKSPATLFAAARAAKAILEAKAAGTRRTARQAEAEEEEDDDRYDRYDDREPEEDRQRRASSQDGSRRRGGADDDDTGALGPQALQVMKAFGVSEDEFTKSAKELGVSGRRRR